jgi:hypothetical protein
VLLHQLIKDVVTALARCHRCTSAARASLICCRRESGKRESVAAIVWGSDDPQVRIRIGLEPGDFSVLDLQQTARSLTWQYIPPLDRQIRKSGLAAGTRLLSPSMLVLQDFTKTITPGETAPDSYPSGAISGVIRSGRALQFFGGDRRPTFRVARDPLGTRHPQPLVRVDDFSLIWIVSGLLEPGIEDHPPSLRIPFSIRCVVHGRIESVNDHASGCRN